MYAETAPHMHTSLHCKASMFTHQYDVHQTSSTALRTLAASVDARGLSKCSTEAYSERIMGNTASGLMNMRHMIKLDRSMSTWGR